MFLIEWFRWVNSTSCNFATDRLTWWCCYHYKTETLPFYTILI